jgi:hypothetical protein
MEGEKLLNAMLVVTVRISSTLERQSTLINADPWPQAACPEKVRVKAEGPHPATALARPSLAFISEDQRSPAP